MTQRRRCRWSCRRHGRTTPIARAVRPLRRTAVRWPPSSSSTAPRRTTTSVWALQSRYFAHHGPERARGRPARRTAARAALRCVGRGDRDWMPALLDGARARAIARRSSATRSARSPTLECAAIAASGARRADRAHRPAAPGLAATQRGCRSVRGLTRTQGRHLRAGRDRPKIAAPRGKQFETEVACHDRQPRQRRCGYRERYARRACGRRRLVVAVRADAATGHAVDGRRSLPALGAASGTSRHHGAAEERRGGADRGAARGARGRRRARRRRARADGRASPTRARRADAAHRRRCTLEAPGRDAGHGDANAAAFRAGRAVAGAVRVARRRRRDCRAHPLPSAFYGACFAGDGLASYRVHGSAHDHSVWACSRAIAHRLPFSSVDRSSRIGLYDLSRARASEAIAGWLAATLDAAGVGSAGAVGHSLGLAGGAGLRRRGIARRVERRAPRAGGADDGQRRASGGGAARRSRWRCELINGWSYSAARQRRRHRGSGHVDDRQRACDCMERRARACSRSISLRVSATTAGSPPPPTCAVPCS